MFMEENRREKYILRFKLVSSVCFLLLAVALLTGTVYAWLRDQRKLQSIAAIETPFMLDIRGGDEKPITFLDLNGIDLSNEQGKSQIVFCVCGNGIESYDLELGYTTNIGFQYKIYPAVKSEAASGTYTEQYIDQQNNNNTSYFYNTANLEMRKLNESTTNPGVGNLNDAYYAATYGDGFDTTYVQENAMPIYELKEGISTRDVRGSADMQFTFVDYYILEVSWKAGAVRVNNKETDMVYLLAENSN